MNTNMRLTSKQKMFIRYYTSGETAWNATFSYMRVYRCNEASARASASRLLTNVSIVKEISKVVEDVIDDPFAKQQLYLSMYQCKDWRAKIRAIELYYKLQGTLVNKSGIVAEAKTAGDVDKLIPEEFYEEYIEFFKWRNRQDTSDKES